MNVIETEASYTVYRTPSFVFKGMKVIAPYWNKSKCVGLRCEVVVAAGNHARVVNEARCFDSWFHIGELKVDGQ